MFKTLQRPVPWEAERCIRTQNVFRVQVFFFFFKAKQNPNLDTFFILMEAEAALTAEDSEGLSSFMGFLSPALMRETANAAFDPQALPPGCSCSKATSFCLSEQSGAP